MPKTYTVEPRDNGFAVVNETGRIVDGPFRYRFTADAARIHRERYSAAPYAQA